MDPITQQAVLAKAGAAGAAGSSALYVDDVFSPYLYSGNNTTNVINNGIDLAGEGGLVWAKCRNNSSTSTGPHSLWDTERGTRQYLVPNTTAASYVIAAQYSQYGLQSFNSNGFTLGINWAYENNPSNSGNDMVSWTFRKAPGFFDIVTYTGNGTAGRTVAHNLGSVPGMIIVKDTSISDSWTIYHRGLGATKAFTFTNSDAGTATDLWNDTEPTSTQFTVGNTGAVNATGSSFVAYVFAHDDASFGTNSDESIIKCGSYTGNGNVAGPTIDLGFEPQYVLIKSDDPLGSNWEIADSMRGVHTGNADAMLSVDNISAEDSSNNRLDFTSTGFNIVTTANDYNANGKTHIYMAIRRPNKPPSAGTEVFTVGSQQINNLTPFYKTSGHISDFVLSGQPSSATNWQVNSRLTGTQTLQTNSNSSETSNSYYVWDYMDGMNSYATSGNNGYYHWSFKRAPGFMDVVAYTGTGSNQNITHNLGVVPELMIIKGRNVATWWMVYTSVIDGSTDYLKLQDTDAKADSSLSLPTSTSIILDTTSSLVNGSYNYISYLFATLPGISKVGTYTGTGNAINVDCGFTSGARFALIKRTDVTGDWYVFDSARGIVSGNDPYVLFNTTAAEVTNTDYIDPLNAGFTVTSSAPAGLNASSGTYLFLAIA